MHKESKIYIAGHRGMVGSAVWRALEGRGYSRLVGRTSKELDLRDRGEVRAFFASEEPDVVVLAAAKVGGIAANASAPAEFLYDNLAIELAVIHAAYEQGVERLLFLGSTCIYPRMAPQPITEDALLTSPLEETNEAYALAKIAGLKLCQAYRRQYGVLFHSAMPTNLYGPGDNYHPVNSHVIPGLIRRFHEARAAGAPEVSVWGSGTPRREFLYVDDLAEAIVHLLELDVPPDWVNVGTGEDITIRELASLVAQTVGFQGRITTNPNKPDGAPRKLTDSTLLFGTGWRPKTSLEDGLSLTYDDFVAGGADS